jgi:DivIVA domain-containing protein
VLSPEDITSRSFLVSLRGYDRDEVHAFLAQVADTVRDLRERADELEELATAPSSDETPAAAAPVEAPAAEPASLFAQIGQETQRILEAAQTAAEEIRGKAEAAAAELRRGAEAETAELRQTAEAEVAELRQTAEAEVAELRQTAEAETAAQRETAQQEADELRRSAKEAAEREVKTARAEATRIIAEGERERETLEATVAGLTATRDELADTPRTVGRSVERSLRDLVPAPAPSATMREAVTAAVREDAEAERPEAAVDEADTADEPTGEDAAAEDAAGEEAAVEESAVAESAVAESAVEESAVESGAAEEPGTDESALAEHEDEAAVEESAGDDTDELPPVAVEAAAAESPDLDEAAAAPEGDGTIPAAVTEAVLADQVSEPTPILMEDAQSLRAQALAPLHPKLVRKLKRGLQDLQNGVLDRLRRADAKGEVDQFLPDYTAVSTLSALSEEFLVTAWWAGTASGELLAGEEVEAPEPEPGLAEELTSAIAERLLDALATGLAEGLGAGEDIVALGERIGVIFSEVKQSPVEELAALALLRTYEAGLLASWGAGHTTHRHWGVATEPPCAEERCAENRRSGPVPIGSPFPSGHMSPPVAVGCNCTTVPVVPLPEPAS